MEADRDAGSVVIISSKCHRQTSFDKSPTWEKELGFSLSTPGLDRERKTPTSLEKEVLAFWESGESSWSFSLEKLTNANRRQKTQRFSCGPETWVWDKESLPYSWEEGDLKVLDDPEVAEGVLGTPGHSGPGVGDTGYTWQ